MRAGVCSSIRSAIDAEASAASWPHTTHAAHVGYGVFLDARALRWNKSDLPAQQEMTTICPPRRPSLCAEAAESVAVGGGAVGVEAGAVNARAPPYSCGPSASPVLSAAEAVDDTPPALCTGGGGEAIGIGGGVGRAIGP
jgi:hypothetical protein